MKKWIVLALTVTVGMFNGVEFRSHLKDDRYIGKGEADEDKLDWFRDRPEHFEIGEEIEVPDALEVTNPGASDLEEVKTALRSSELARGALLTDLEEVKTAAVNAVGDLQGHLDQIAVLTGAKDGTMDAIAKALKTFKPK